MKRILIAGAAVLAVLASGQILSAQTTTAPAETKAAPAPAQTAVVIAPEQRATIKAYVVKEKVKPVVLKDKVIVGATLPAGVELAPVPQTWGPSLTKYQYVYSDNRVVLVDPTGRKVVQIIE
jgi:hypothetical protein